MQPDPVIYLLRARDELLTILASGAVKSQSAALSIDRIAELLAQLAVRLDELPIMLRQIRPRQLELFRATLAAMAEAGIDPPAGTVDILRDGNPASDPTEIDIRKFDAVARIQAACLGEMAAIEGKGAEFAFKLDRLLHAARALEAGISDEYQAGLESKKEAFQVHAQTADEAERGSLGKAELEHFLRQRFDGASEVRVETITRFRGVNTKDIIFFDLFGVPGWPSQIVMRRLRGFNVNLQVSMPYEFALLNALRDAGIKVPRALLVETNDVLGHPFIMMERLPGNARKAEDLRENGRGLAEQMARHLAAIHALDPAIGNREDLGLTARDRLLAHVNYNHVLWANNHVEPSAAVVSGFKWIRDHISDLSDQTVLVHGDFDLRNLLIEGDTISAVLDWERSHIGHPAEDLAYCRPDVEKLMPWLEFLKIYRASGGKQTTDRELNFFKTWAQLFRLVAINRAHYGYANSEHSDFLLGSAGFIEARRALGVLRTLLEESEGAAQ